MEKAARVRRPSSAVLALVGLLALLLWGQCASFMGALFQVPHYAARVVAADSLSAATPTTPPMLHLVVEIHNDNDRDFTLRRAYGSMDFGRYTWPESNHDQGRGLLVPAGSVRTLALALPLATRPPHAPVPAKVQSELLEVLRRGPNGSGRPMLRLKVEILTDSTHMYPLDEKGKRLQVPALRTNP
ncbi:hypothetical protein [Hymenobacter guriensis]|uniref:Late embryogenesis abundant protein LEA-2 subgroup domain-containing protein n=1 Tax=Hymenobacter guriensis TaxID=2793065 RepID=A0ABS0L193_9BACT|nr:hypothetical protein [Hymenobacter guriensis]MBG8553884.1 hypothetical protein [Hymenobacter guriensis]